MPVQVPFFSGHKLSINLAEDTVILRGLANDDGTFVLRGEVELVVTKPINVTSVVIKMVGKSFTLWTDGIGSGRNTRYSYEKKIHEQDLVLQTWTTTPTSTPITSRSGSASSFKSIKGNNKDDTSGTVNGSHGNNSSSGTLTPGLHRWPFEFFLSNKLVETIEDETGKVFYYLTAIIHRPSGIQSKIKCRRNVLVLRTPHWSDNALTANSLPTTSIISDRQHPACDATICVEKSMASSGTQFPIDITLAPNLKNVFLESISVLLSERRVYRLPEFDVRRGEMYDFKLRLLSITNLSDMTTYTPTDEDEEEQQQHQQQQMTLDQQVRRAIFMKNAHVPLTGDPFQFRFVFNLPNCIDLNHSSTFNEIDIRHFLKLAIGIQSPAGPSTLRLDTNITVLDCRLKEDYAALPTYEAALSDLIVDTEDDPTNIIGNRSGFFICPCYLDYKKKRQVSSKKEWIMMRHNHQHQQHDDHHNQSEITSPPSYDTISPGQSSSHLVKL
ncbi:hypothetical protein [Absidia glauca]|uniref:Arrestin-like N-terminal domain-containing protein n=1 Tax=Absidia glauca TaxID=4829 RepID=A0A168MRD0_ABSGL|nr:hypothetical protein [Absidia glauca]